MKQGQQKCMDKEKKKKKDFSLAPLDHCHHANVILAAD